MSTIPPDTQPAGELAEELAQARFDVHDARRALIYRMNDYRLADDDSEAAVQRALLDYTTAKIDQAWLDAQHTLTRDLPDDLHAACQAEFDQIVEARRTLDSIDADLAAAPEHRTRIASICAYLLAVFACND